jgi:hypothetical protein
VVGRQKHCPITALGYCPLQKPHVCALIKSLSGHKLFISMECLVYLTYTKNEVDHGTFWTPDQKELSFRIDLRQRVIFLQNAPLYVISMSLKLFV